MTAPEILRRAKALIADEQNWWDGCGELGDRKCTLSAISSISWPRPDALYNWKGEAAMHRVVGESIGAFNDSHTHAEVMAAFDKAIALAEADQ